MRGLELIHVSERDWRLEKYVPNTYQTFQNEGTLQTISWTRWFVISVTDICYWISNLGSYQIVKIQPLVTERQESYGNRNAWKSWRRHQMETFSALLAICVGNSPVTCEFSAQRPVMRSFNVFFDLRLNKWLSKQSWGWWFETPSCSL